jgi:hypothetical protein
MDSSNVSGKRSVFGVCTVAFSTDGRYRAADEPLQLTLGIHLVEQLLEIRPVT